jgi:DNA-binding CsgD family transcriptional regulator
MAAPTPQRSPEQIEAMRRELLEEGCTLQQIADREGITRQRVYQLVGPLRRGHSRMQDTRERIVALYEAGKSDVEISQIMDITKQTVRRHLRKAGISLLHGNAKYS